MEIESRNFFFFFRLYQSGYQIAKIELDYWKYCNIIKIERRKYNFFLEKIKTVGSNFENSSSIKKKKLS